MKVRIEYLDGTERVFKECNYWALDRSSGLYEVQKRTEVKIDPVHVTKLFSRKVTTEPAKTKTTTDTRAWVSSNEVLLIELIK
jgi:hypothetical protein